MLLSDKFKYHINSAHCALYFAPSKTEVSALSSMFAAINNDFCKKLMLHLSWHIAKESYLQQSEKWMIVWFTETKFGIYNVCENKQEFLLSVGRRKQRLSQILSASKHLQTTQLRIILPRKYGTYCKKNNFKYNLPKLKKKFQIHGQKVLKNATRGSSNEKNGRKEVWGCQME